MKPASWPHSRRQAAYILAERELGDDALRFRTALLSYAYAVDLESRARAEWEREKRPLNPGAWCGGSASVGEDHVGHVAVGGVHAAQLGLTPASAKRISPQRRPSRPVGAVSASDRALPGIQYNPGEPPRLALAGPGPLLKGALRR